MSSFTYELVQAVVTVYEAGDTVLNEHHTDCLWVLDGKPVGVDHLPIRIVGVDDGQYTRDVYAVTVEPLCPVLMNEKCGTSLMGLQIGECGMWDTFSDDYEKLARIVGRHPIPICGTIIPLITRARVEDRDGVLVWMGEIVGELDMEQLRERSI